MHFNVTAHPTAVWTAQQLIEAFPEDKAPRFLIRDRDQIYREHFRNRVAGMGIEEVVMAARSPWQNPYAERLIGSVRRECLDLVIVLSEEHLRVPRVAWSHSNEILQDVSPGIARTHRGQSEQSPNRVQNTQLNIYWRMLFHP